jgi:hypothetical protein
VTEIEDFIRSAAELRGINPDVAVRVCQTEGGVTEPASLGDFSAGRRGTPGKAGGPSSSTTAGSARRGRRSATPPAWGMALVP